jgi:large subunit ribosomal protein L24
LLMGVPRIRKNDVVVAIAGEDAGKSGKVIEVLPAKGRALVEGLNIIKKTIRKSQEAPKGGIVEKESPIAISRLMLSCPQCKKGVRTGRVTDGDRRVRKCKSCGHLFEN